MTDEDLALLALIHQLKRPTAADLRRQAQRERPMYDLYRRLERLERAGLVSKTLLYPERGARSPRYYHLRAAGARVLGLAAVGSDHYRRPDPAVYHAGQLRRELALIAERQHWRLLTEEAEMKQCLASVLIAAAQATYGEQFPAHTLLPPTLKVHPDLLLDTGQRVVLVMIGHPHASAVFWRKRIARYQPILGAMAAVCFVLSEQQRRDAEAAAQASLYVRRLLVLGPDELGELVRRLAPSP
jgi:DNA-binding PadR family transcriptional regulator